MTEKKATNHDKYLKAIRKERALNKRKDSFNDRIDGTNEGLWPEWYRKARK